MIANRGVQAELTLPIAGLLSDAPLAEVVDASHQCVEAAERLGCSIPSAFQTLSFLALSMIPKLKITDRGLVDVDRFRGHRASRLGICCRSRDTDRWSDRPIDS